MESNFRPNKEQRAPFPPKTCPNCALNGFMKKSNKCKNHPERTNKKVCEWSLNDFCSFPMAGARFSSVFLFCCLFCALVKRKKTRKVKKWCAHIVVLVIFLPNENMGNCSANRHHYWCNGIKLQLLIRSTSGGLSASNVHFPFFYPYYLLRRYPLLNTACWRCFYIYSPLTTPFFSVFLQKRGENA